MKNIVACDGISGADSEIFDCFSGEKLTASFPRLNSSKS